MGQNQPLFVKFYNLHLDCCLTIIPRNEINKDEFWYRVEMPEKVREEIELSMLIHSIKGPSNLQHEWKAKYWVKRDNQFVLAQQEEIDEQIVPQAQFRSHCVANCLARNSASIFEFL